MFCFFLVLLLQVNSTIFQCTWKKCRVIHKTVEEIEDHVREAHLGYVQLNFRTHNSSYHIGKKKSTQSSTSLRTFQIYWINNNINSCTATATTPFKRKTEINYESSLWSDEVTWQQQTTFYQLIISEHCTDLMNLSISFSIWRRVCWPHNRWRYLSNWCCSCVHFTASVQSTQYHHHSAVQWISFSLDNDVGDDVSKNTFPSRMESLFGRVKFGFRSGHFYSLWLKRWRPASNHRQELFAFSMENNHDFCCIHE